jgi:hypothetical protein
MKTIKMPLIGLLAMLFLGSGCKTSKESLGNELQVVTQFTGNLDNWGRTKDVDYRIGATKLCDVKDGRISNAIMIDLARKDKKVFSDELNGYKVDNYLNCFQKAIEKGTFGVSANNYKQISYNEKSVVSSNFNKKRTNMLALNITNISCNLKVTGSLNYDVSDLYFIRDGKIIKIDSLTIDQNNKVRVDLSDIDDIRTYGGALNYDQHFPVGASAIIQSGWFVGSVDIGVNFDSKIYTKESLEFTDVSNYRRIIHKFDPRFFITITPGVNLKYISLGCGFGLVGGDKKVETSENTNLHHNWEEKTEGGGKFILRPQIRGYIPLSEDWNMSVGVGYDIVANMKELNGYNFSLGLHYYY